MTKAFCPGHVTCFFVPIVGNDIHTTGSVGVGIKVDKGTTVTLEERSDEKLKCTMNGVATKCPITESAIRRISKRGFDVTIENALPVSQGFGMSASGSIAAAMCAADYESLSFSDAVTTANVSDIEGKGGLGDVAAIINESHVPIRMKPGIPPYGLAKDSGLSFDKASLILLNGNLPTKNVLTNEEIMNKIKISGTECLNEFTKSPSKDILFSLSKKFSSEIGLETESISKLLKEIPNACMCMLGHSIFVDMPAEKVRSYTDAKVIECSSTNALPFICKE